MKYAYQYGSDLAFVKLGIDPVPNKQDYINEYKTKGLIGGGLQTGILGGLLGGAVGGVRGAVAGGAAGGLLGAGLGGREGKRHGLDKYKDDLNERLQRAQLEQLHEQVAALKNRPPLFLMPYSQ